MLKNLYRYIDRVEEVAISFSIIFMAIVLIGNVIARTVLNHSWTFAEEIGQFMVIINVFMGISYAAKRARHINMSAFFDIAPPRVQKIMMLIISAGTSLSMFYVGYLGTNYVLRVYELARVSPALRIPMWIMLLFVPLGFLTAGIQYARNFVKNIREEDIYIGEMVKIGEDRTGEGC